jgi:hypothetical protein
MRPIVPHSPTTSSVSLPTTQDLAASLLSASRYVLSQEQYANAVAYALESWPIALHKLSFLSYPIELSQVTAQIVEQLWAEIDFGFEAYSDAHAAWAHAETILQNAKYLGGNERSPLMDIDAVADLYEEIGNALSILRKDGFERPVLKLGTISPKDSCFWSVSSGRIENAAQAFLLIFTSQRVMTNIANDVTYQKTAAAVRHGSPHPNMTTEAIAKAEHIPYHLPYLWLRAFESFAPHQEFRCFVKNGVFLGGTQYHKITSDPQSRYFEALPFPDLVTRGSQYERGRTVMLRPHWDTIRIGIMRDLLHKKFAPGSSLARELLATADRELIEGNTRNDRFWGVCLRTRVGENHLGRLLMEIRSELRALAS